MSGRNDGQTRLGNSLAGRWLGRTSVRAKALELRVSETKANATLGCTNKDAACEAWAEALFLSPAGAELQLEVRQLVLGYGTPRRSAPRLGVMWGAAMGLTGGLENITYEDRPNALTAVVLPEEGKKSISTCGAAKRKGITLLSACGAARKFLVSHWGIIIAGKGREAEDR